ncbi:hypothetical protein ymoll0001_4720 [Yersinia mollaretii ATCC 43969]|uniref:Uncharacterized protein n=1 Tax=Yersinia mollaretii (strain ATCC 43969 / DSM 18520 / CIP 103324 / CNY 7263 / WAIP 204) TaxID=349967 RepID=A0ABP2EHC8_YERMW|nr:hypothetical protein ymoll0001_4720 [Yersinia mollaretii ATCC 43969]CQD37053.1 Uncharacterised protein [Yersinia mollaretii]
MESAIDLILNLPRYTVAQLFTEIELGTEEPTLLLSLYRNDTEMAEFWDEQLMQARV